MPALENPRHERFAQDLAKGMSQAEAYRNAGYRPNDPAASRLARNVKVQARVAEIVDRGAIRTEITLQSLMEEAAEIQRAAVAAGQHSAAVAALTAKAKLAGLWVEKAENLNRNMDANGLSDAELAAIVAGDGGRGAAATPGNSSKPH
jgi:phage terminase small subunit